jgi:hypothetical protein
MFFAQFCDKALLFSVNVFVLRSSDLKRKGLDLGHQVLLWLECWIFVF